MGNHHGSHIKSVHSLSGHKDEILTIRSRRSDIKESSASKRISSSDEQLISELKNIKLLNQLLKKNAETDKAEGIPTVFRWYGRGDKIYISGSFNNWSEKILLTKSDTLYYTIVNCSPGHHTYKFLVDGEWVHDINQPTEMNSFGTLNNWLKITEDDLDIDFVLNHDEKFSTKSSDSEPIEDPNAAYGQLIPTRPFPSTGTKLSTIVPRNLPPYLNENVLNIEDAEHNDPNLLRTPVYVQINHMYASSITAGIAALSVTIRYRTKFITTVFYKPIS